MLHKQQGNKKKGKIMNYSQVTKKRALDRKAKYSKKQTDRQQKEDNRTQAHKVKIESLKSFLAPQKKADRIEVLTSRIANLTKNIKAYEKLWQQGYITEGQKDQLPRFKESRKKQKEELEALKNES